MQGERAWVRACVPALLRSCARARALAGGRVSVAGAIVARQLLPLLKSVLATVKGSGCLRASAVAWGVATVATVICYVATVEFPSRNAIPGHGHGCLDGGHHCSL